MVACVNIYCTYGNSNHNQTNAVECGKNLMNAGRVQRRTNGALHIFVWLLNRHTHTHSDDDDVYGIRRIFSASDWGFGASTNWPPAKGYDVAYNVTNNIPKCGILHCHHCVATLRIRPLDRHVISALNVHHRSCLRQAKYCIGQNTGDKRNGSLPPNSFYLLSVCGCVCVCVWVIVCMNWTSNYVLLIRLLARVEYLMDAVYGYGYYLTGCGNA